ncbi:hypothetical protein [Dethiobacter alkaliphilus]|uniref:hypothetical protein n=1 Tax=Dethiobacter alkaliphilus TaxID=427926 RepID=UPI002227F268|nr:hypothetical protein [Dethiobacter alkaliphilus]MCW3491609.1 hypothetical protein [Dethiobacter alkaliphilus]
MIAAIVFALLGFACLVYSIYAYKEKGPLISSIYFVAAPAQREKMKTKENYWTII